MQHRPRRPLASTARLPSRPSSHLRRLPRPLMVGGCNRLAVTVALLALALGSAAFAQAPLAELASPNAAIAIGVDTTGAPPAALRRDLASIDWRGAAETVAAVAQALELSDSAEPMKQLFTLFDPATNPIYGLADELCPGLAAPLRALAPGERPLPSLVALLTAELAAGEPVLTGLIRFSGIGGTRLAMLRLALRRCADETERVAEVPVELLHFGQGPDSATLLLLDDGLLIASSDRQAALDVWRRAAPGSAHAASWLAETSSRFTGGSPSVSFSARPLPFLDLLYGLGLVDLHRSDPLGVRLIAAADTVDQLAGHWSIGESGPTSEWSVEIDPARPDPELARLLLCPQCRAPRPHLAPEGGYTVVSGRLPLNGLVDWLSAWLIAAGEPDPMETVRRETGIDLRADLLDWLGDQGHLLILEPYSSDLNTLLYQPGEVVLLPVSSEEAAAAGLDRLESVLVEHLRAEEGRLLGEVPLALRHGEYRGVPYRRLQTSINLDLGIALIGNHLAVAAPAAALEPIVDTYLGGPGFVSDGRYRSLAREVPATAQSLSFQDTSAQLVSLARMVRLLAQPLAFGLDIAQHNRAQHNRQPDGWSIGLAGTTALPLPDGPALSGALTDGYEPGTASDQLVEGQLSDLFRLERLQAGDRVTVVVESDDFDTMLYLLDGQQELVLDFNDDAPDVSRSELLFTARSGVDYLVQVTSFEGDDTGEYLLTVETEPGELELGMPDFTRILELLELPAELLDLLAAHFHTTVGYTVSEGNTVYSRTVTSPTR
jgi:hypothetical protein